MFTSLQLHDFLVAAMIICLDFYESHTRPVTATAAPQDAKAQSEKYDALKLSHDIWSSRKTTSQDARRASDVLAVMLSKVARPNIMSNLVNISQDMLEPEASARDPMDSFTNSPWTDNGTTIPGQDFLADNNSSNTVNPLDTIFGVADDIDWVSRQLFQICLDALLN